nr:MAG TPA: hypothetical protein [Caudoviricetes sp.]
MGPFGAPIFFPIPHSQQPINQGDPVTARRYVPRSIQESRGHQLRTACKVRYN